MTERKLIDRPPRIQPELPYNKIEIPAPPEKDNNANMALLQMALPMLMIAGYIFVAMFSGGQGRNPLLILPMGLAVIGSSAFAWYTHQRTQKLRKEKEDAYTARLLEMRDEMNNYHDMQRRFYRYNYLATANVLRMAEDTEHAPEQHHEDIRSGSRLWERRVSDEDFGVVRLGMGTLPSTVIYEFNQADNFEDPQIRDAIRLAEDSRYVPDVPVTISLRQPKKEDGPTDETAQADGDDEKTKRPLPITHALGIAGDPRAVYRSIWAMLTHYTAFHAPTDARLYVLGAKKSRWEWASTLPHCQGDEQSANLCFEDALDKSSEEPQNDDEAGGVAQFLEGLRRILAQRQLQLNDKDSEGAGDPTIPFLLLVVDLLATPGDESALKELESDAAISILLQQGPVLGAAVIFLVPERSKVPSGCRSVIEVDHDRKEGDTSYTFYFRYAETGVNTWRYVGEADVIDDAKIMGAFANRLQKLDVRKSYGSTLTTSVPFLDMLGEANVDTLRSTSRKMWERNLSPRHGDWLRVKIGMMSGNKPRALTFSAKRDGVHGMIAGSTGSGKSELLVSMITGLAAYYDPTSLNFVLVDYKGGGAFKDFENMPHCVDVITNLQAGGVTRMFTAIQSELKRRQGLNVRTATKDIVEYRKKGYHLDETKGPYPFLFIIIDEFAEMVAASPQFRTELESITRVGRASGVHLLLAAQRPSGVTDQMRSNIKFRICLRVEGPEESREMLRRSEAAYLPSNIPGRGYLQVGNDNLDAIQVAYTGDKYLDPSIKQFPVIWPQRRKGESAVSDQEPPKVYQAVVDMLTKLATERGLSQQSAPWPKALPTKLALTAELTPAKPELSPEKLVEQDVITLGKVQSSALTLNPAVNRWQNSENAWEGIDWRNYAMRPVVGLIDDPYNARRLPLTVKLREGHVAIFGSSGWGKTTFIRSLVVSLAATHAPNELNMYILDLGGRNLSVLAEFPHVGAVILPDEQGYEERVTLLLRELENEIEKRKKLFTTAGVADLYQYNTIAKENIQPAVLVVIDNFVEFRETFGKERDKQASVLDEFIGLARQCKAYGIHIVVTANQLNVLSNKLFSLFTERLTLKLADASEYRAIVGGSIMEVDNILGRGYIKDELQALEFQIALPFDPQAKAETAEIAGDLKEIRQFAETMKRLGGEAVQIKPLLSVGALPKVVRMEELVKEVWGGEQVGLFHEHLKTITRQKWDESFEAEAEADWLSVPIGKMSGGKPRNLHFFADVDGVHGMIAGTSGSGKSELLTTLIVGLALRYDPSILNFVLVDYKGGGAFTPFKNLPHCVDIITNLHQSGVVRMFTAINAELKRRQQLTTDTKTKDIVEYRRKGLHKTYQPLPHMFIIIDEYAEMITDNADFKVELDRITRVGRSAGVHLILAAQRPTGVTDQMRANIKFRICLRVENPDDSREILRRSDAAFLPNGTPGRGYIQVGNENLDLIQVAWAGERIPESRQEEDEPKGPRMFEVAVRVAAELMREVDNPMRQPRRPWPDFLPTNLTLHTPLNKSYFRESDLPKMAAALKEDEPLTLNPAITTWLSGQGKWSGMKWQENGMKTAVGIIDNPENARREPLYLDLTREHAVIFGDAGWGKTTFLRSLIVGLAATHSPDELHVYALDLGRNLSGLRKLPHLGDDKQNGTEKVKKYTGNIISPDEEEYDERLRRLLDKLNGMVTQRTRLFSEANVTGDLYDYNTAVSRSPLPAVLVVIDNFAELKENYEMLLDMELIPLVRNALRYGIHFVVTANGPNAMPSKLYSLFGLRLALKLANQDWYADIVGRGAIPVDITGRGYVRAGRSPLAFQLAYPVGAADEETYNAEVERDGLERLIQQMNQTWNGRLPERIEFLPKEIPLMDVLTLLPPVRSANAPIEGVLGKDASLGVATFDLKKFGPHFLVAGPPLSGKTTALRSWILSLAYRYPPERVMLVLVDLQKKLFEYGGGRNLSELPHVVTAVTEIEELEALLPHLQNECIQLASQPSREIFVIIDNYDDLNDELANKRKVDQELAFMARRYGTQGVHFIIGGVLDGTPNDLRRRVQGAKYGIGLKTADALEKLSVLKVPAGMRDKDLNLGRGFIAKTGQVKMVQVATPYEGMVPSLAASADDEFETEEKINRALDAWIEKILERHTGPKVRWSDQSETASANGEATQAEAVNAGQAKAMLDLLRRVIKQTTGMDASDWDEASVVSMANDLLPGSNGGKS